MISSIVLAAALVGGIDAPVMDAMQKSPMQKSAVQKSPSQKADNVYQKGVSVEVSRGRVAVRARRAAVRVERRRWFGRRACRNGRCG